MIKIKFARLFPMLTREYWACAIHPKKKLLTLCITSLLVALHVAISTFFIPVGEGLRIFFSFIPMAVACAIGGPFIALGYGFASDMLAYLIHPTGAFFPGYTLTAMLSALIYALFLYKSRPTVLRIFFCKLCVNVLANILLNSVWNVILLGQGYLYYLAKSVVKNLLMLPIEVLLLVIIFKAINPTLCKMGLLEGRPAD